MYVFGAPAADHGRIGLARPRHVAGLVLSVIATSTGRAASICDAGGVCGVDAGTRSGAPPGRPVANAGATPFPGSSSSRRPLIPTHCDGALHLVGVRRLGRIDPPRRPTTGAAVTRVRIRYIDLPGFKLNRSPFDVCYSFSPRRHVGLMESGRRARLAVLLYVSGSPPQRRRPGILLLW